MAAVRGPIASATASASMSSVSSSTSTSLGVAPARVTASARDERVGRHDDLTARFDPDRAERQLEGVRAVGHTDTVRDARIGGVLLFESRHLVAEDERRSVEHGCEAARDLCGHPGVLRREVDEWNGGKVCLSHEISFALRPPDE